MLGPLEVIDADRPVALGGIKQRATLGFLLLQANRVVATSQLLRALWPVDEAPTSARKILQNAVWGLRGVLSAGTAENGGAGGPALLTQAPGYVLRVDPDDVDLHRFQRQVEAGRAKFSAGAPEDAATLLREALTLWQGPALADLVETGIAWPELAAVEKARLDAMEDYFEAELACGRHQGVLGELETMVATESLRERSCGQLMLALYRCGRQADALAVYDKVRTTLVEDLGLEPGRSLRDLQHAILTHDTSLSLPLARPLGAAPYQLGRRPAREQSVEIPAQRRPLHGGVPLASVPDPAPAGAAHRARTAVTAPDGRRTAATVTERTQVSVALIATELAEDTPGGAWSESADAALEAVAGTVQEKAEYFGGTVVASIGPVTLALFGACSGDGDRKDAAERAVHASLAVRAALGSGAYATGRHGRRPAVRAAVVTGDAIVRYRPDDPGTPPTLIGTLLHTGQSLLDRVPAGEVRVCANTREAADAAVSLSPAGDAATGWEVRGIRREYPGEHTVPIVDRDCELDLLRGLLSRTRHRAKPHLVTVLGDPGIGKTRFVTEFARAFADQPEPARFLVGRAPSFPGDDALAVQSEILAAACGILPGQPAGEARAHLAATVRRVIADPREADRLLPPLTPLVTPGHEPAAPAEALAAWRRFVVALAAERPLVLIIDDLHRADDALLDCVEDLVETAGVVPLLVVAAARPELLQRRPDWGAGKRHTSTLGLDPLSDAAIDRLLEFMIAPEQAAHAGEAPDDRRRYMRQLLASGSPSGALRHLYGRTRTPRSLPAAV
ncbi:BTAD domain-containing putative transcriptional regulator [Streptomyces sp. NPDC037389]|uniref:BTAD domain-containing putative transcriptional regulator n=1 Tax=Streptomyces sp. NPDC037389 TaxID=3155369 RepID=UPI0034016CAD